MVNRLQFIHHNEIFPNRESLIQYVKELQINSRPSLFAEPMVLKYESDDATKGPNVVLAIGSNGIGEYNEEFKPTDQRTFFIDVTEQQEDIETLFEELEKAIKALTLIPLESDTIKTFVEKTEDGTIISGDVKTPQSKVIDSIERPNQIQTIEDEGLFHFVDLEYTQDGTLRFQVNEYVNEMNIPVITSGEYVYTGDDAEKLILTANDGSKIKIDLGKLIDEWTVMPSDANQTPIILKREEVRSEECPHGVETWQDVLSADVRLHGGDGNIILKYDSGQTLYAKVVLDYDDLENKLVFTWTEDGEIKTKEMKLNGVNVIESITYDSVTEEIVIVYKTSQSGEPIELRIPISSIIREWDVNNEGHNVIFNKSTSISGIDILTADVRIWDGDTNILETKGEGKSLYIRGEADNIKFGTSDVDTELKRLNNEKIRVEGRLDDEIARATAKETELTDKIGSGFTTDVHRNVTAKFNELTDLLNDTIDDLQDETLARQNADSDLSDRIDAEEARAISAESANTTAINNEVARAQNAEQILTNNLNSEITRATNKEGQLETTIGTAFTTDAHETVSYKFNELSAKTDQEIETRTSQTTDLRNRIDAEESRAMGVEDILRTEINKTNDKIGTGFTSHDTVADAINKEIQDRTTDVNDEEARAISVENVLRIDLNAVSSDTETRLQSVKNTDGTIEVINANRTNPVVNTIVSSEQKNIIIKDNGLRAYVNLTYTPQTNTLHFQINDNEETDIELVGMSVFDRVYYDANTEEIVLVYTVNGVIRETRIPVGDLIEEWEVDNHDHSVKLTKVRSTSGKDKLSADVNVSNASDNILEVVEGDNGEYLKVSNAPIVALDNKLDDFIVEQANTDDAIRGLIEQEATARANADNTLSTAISNESSTRSQADNNLSNLISAETTNRTNADNDLRTSISDERNERISSDSTLDTKISNETSARHAADSTLENKISAETASRQSADQNLAVAISAETTARVQADSALETLIDEERTARTDAVNSEKTTRISEISRVEGLINTEKTDRIAGDNTINATISSFSADTQTKINATNNNVSTLSGKVNTNTSNISTLQNTVATHSEGIAEINTKIGTGFTADGSNNVTAKFNALSGQVNTLSGSSITGISSNGSIIVNNSNPRNPNVSVNIDSTHNNIIELSNGIRAYVNLTYTELTNTLHFQINDNTPIDIKLASISVLDSIYYDHATEEIVLVYTVEGHVEYTRIPIGDMIREWEASSSTSGAIRLTKTESTSGTDVLSADIIINSLHTDNAIVNDSGSLYVSKEGILSGVSDYLTFSPMNQGTQTNHNIVKFFSTQTQDGHTTIYGEVGTIELGDYA